MTLTPQAAKQIMVIGITELVLSVIAIISCTIAMSKAQTTHYVTVVVTIYIAISGILSIAAGYYKNINTMGLAMAANVLVTAFSAVGVFYSILLDYNGAITIVIVTHGLLVLVSFMGFILGCLTTCCLPRENQPNILMANQNAGRISARDNLQRGYHMQQLSSQRSVPCQQAFPGNVPQLRPFYGCGSQHSYPKGSHQRQGCPTCMPQSQRCPRCVNQQDDTACTSNQQPSQEGAVSKNVPQPDNVGDSDNTSL